MRPSSSLFTDFWLCLGFYSRLPIPRAMHEATPHSLAHFSRAVRVLPLVGAVLGAFAALAMGVALGLGLPPPLAAPLALGCLILLSGALHEDGLADCTDGFFGGATRERKLEIMRDSRIGTFGAVALALSLYVRAASLALIAGESLGLAAAVLIGAAALSRTTALIPLAVLPPARENGAGFTAGKPEPAALAAAACLGVVFALAPVLAGTGPVRALAAIAVATGAAYAIVPLARKLIGGQTGDVAGAAQQLSEIAFYLAFAARV
jgi:adenosylcobinamide-GDP ribazoletransferase